MTRWKVGRIDARGRVHVDGHTLRRIANDFPETRRALRLWTMINGMKEYMLHVLRTTPDGERQVAKQWLAEMRRTDSPLNALRGSSTPCVDKLTATPTDRSRIAQPARPSRPTSIPSLHTAMEKGLNVSDPGLDKWALRAVLT